MRDSELLEFIKRQPFIPFDIKTDDACVYLVDHPEFVHLSRDGKVLYHNTLEDDRLVVIDVSHIVSIEDANRPAAA
jgi:hypothetical protein